MNKDSLGHRMKDYEMRSQSHLPRRCYTMIRIDGSHFHSYLKGCVRPYDITVMNDMDETAKFLCENIQGCKLAYVQSDEITLVLVDFEKNESQAFFDGNVQKITSTSASMASAKFNQLRRDTHSGYCDTDYATVEEYKDYMNELSLAWFDSRCWVISDWAQVYCNFVWRQQDAMRNSKSMLGQANFSHTELQNKSCNTILEMLEEKGIKWSGCPEGFQRGRCVVKEEYEATTPYVDEATMQQIVTRSRWVVVTPPVFTEDKNWIWNHIPRLS